MSRHLPPSHAFSTNACQSLNIRRWNNLPAALCHDILGDASNAYVDVNPPHLRIDVTFAWCVAPGLVGARLR